MLYWEPSTSTPPSQRHPRVTITVSGQSIAKGLARNQHSRAHLAALWILGALTIQKPTARQASGLFGACEALIRKARQELETTTVAVSPLAAAWHAASPAEREGFARAHLADLWDLIDRLTR
jgi:hypothetical protein